MGSGAMALAHAMAAFALVTLIGEAMVLSLWENSLAELREQLEERRGRTRLFFETEDPAEPSPDEIAGAGRVFDRGRRSLLRLCTVPAYLGPMIGFVRSVRAAGFSTLEQGLPLFVSLVEAGLVVMLGLGVSHSGRAVRLGWQALMTGQDQAAAFAGPRGPERPR